MLMLCGPIFTLSQSIAISVCMFVCLSAFISQTTRPNFIKFSVHVKLATARSCSDDAAKCYTFLILWMTSHNEANRPESQTTLCFSLTSPGGDTGAKNAQI